MYLLNMDRLTFLKQHVSQSLGTGVTSDSRKARLLSDHLRPNDNNNVLLVTVL